MLRVQREREWLEKYLAPLVGCVVIEVRARVDGGQVWPVITAQRIPNLPPFDEQEGFELEISRDSEGNGPGFIFGLDTVLGDGRPKADVE